MSQNEPRSAWIRLTEFKWTSIALIELEQVQMNVNEPKWA